MAEPVGRDVAVGVPDVWRARAVFAAGPAAGAVAGVRATAVLAPALRRVVGGEGAVPVLAAFLVWLGHCRHGSRTHVAAPGLGSFGWPIGKDQVIAAESIGGHVGLDLGGDLRAELEPPVFLVLRVVLDQEPPALRV